eukprot:scpid105765/ scgid20654/ 
MLFAYSTCSTGPAPLSSSTPVQRSASFLRHVCLFLSVCPCLLVLLPLPAVPCLHTENNSPMRTYGQHLLELDLRRFSLWPTCALPFSVQMSSVVWVLPRALPTSSWSTPTQLSLFAVYSLSELKPVPSVLASSTSDLFTAILSQYSGVAEGTSIRHWRGHEWVEG